jgi:hypothetical protein
VTAGKIGLRNGGECGLADPDRRELSVFGEQIARVEDRFRRGLEALANSHHEGAEEGPLQRAVGKQIAHQCDVA